MPETPRESELEILRGFREPPKGFTPSPPGVLLSDEIERHVTAYKLICDFSPRQLKPAAYELRVGDACSVGGVTRSLSGGIGANEFRIDPFDVAIIQTLERINMPENLIARWNIRVHWAYEGLLWVGGPQVDAGYKGLLFCPLYNLSNKSVTLKRGDSIAVIDFVTTTPHGTKSIAYARPEARKKLVLDDYNPNLQSALATEARDKIAAFDARLNQVQSRVDQYTAITFAAVAILVAALAALAGRAPNFDLWNLGFIIAVVAVAIELYALYQLRAEASTLAFQLRTAAVGKVGLKTGPFYLLATTIVFAVITLGLLNRFVFTEPIDHHINQVQVEANKSTDELRRQQSQLDEIKKKLKI